MLPPVDPTVLERNPNFDVLYKDLCTRKLNKDGSTRDTKKMRLHAEIRRNLTTMRTNLHQTNFLTQALSTLPSRSETLPQDLHSAIDLVASQLSGQIPSAEDRAILEADTHAFLTNIDIIAEALSDHLTTTAHLVATIANPTSPPDLDALAARATELRKEATETLPGDLAAEKMHLANTTRDLLATHLDLLHSAILILERTQHGALSRAASTHAEHLAARASLLGLQARLHTHVHPPPAEFVAALKRFRAEQGVSEGKLKDREGLARRALDLYARAGEKGMRELAGRKGVLVKEIERVEGEVKGLER